VFSGPRATVTDGVGDSTLTGPVGWLRVIHSTGRSPGREDCCRRDTSTRAPTETSTGVHDQTSRSIYAIEVAVIVTKTVAETDEVVIVNNGDVVAPAATVTDDGTPRPDRSQDSPQARPPGRTAQSYLLAVAETPPPPTFGDRVTETSAPVHRQRRVLFTP